MFEPGAPKTEVAKGYHPTKLADIMPMNVHGGSTRIADPKVAESADLFSVSSVCADCEVGDASSFADIASLDSVLTNHPVRARSLACYYPHRASS